jgi:hypothetical protein
VTRSWALAALVVLAAGSAAGCGDDENSSETRAVEVPTATVTTPAMTATTPAPAATTPATTETLPPSTAGGQPAPGAEDEPGGAGDEEGTRVPAAFELTGETATPKIVDVPAFLPVELSFASRDGKDHAVTVLVTPPVTIQVKGDGKAYRRRVPGLKRGSYHVVVDGKESGAVVRAGQAAGP